MVDLKPFGIDEPVVAESVKAGVNVVSFSGDKLLGGPQAGIIAGEPELIASIRENPMFRALRVDKLIYQALEATFRRLLFCRWDEIPALRMMTCSPSGSACVRSGLRRNCPGWDVDVRPGVSVIGGGSTPEQALPTWLLSIRVPDTVRFEEAIAAGRSGGRRQNRRRPPGFGSANCLRERGRGTGARR